MKSLHVSPNGTWCNRIWSGARGKSFWPRDCAMGVKLIATEANPGSYFIRLYPELPHTIVDPARPSPGWTVIRANDRVLIRHSVLTPPLMHGTDYNSPVNAMQSPKREAHPRPGTNPSR
jgi:hypothetical protein